MTWRSEDAPPPRPDGMEAAPGYRLLGHIHRSRVLDVHDAWSEERDTRCVVKMLRPDRADDAGAARRLRAEARLLTRLSHPHIVRGYAAPGAPEPVAVTETLAGSTLCHLLETHTRLESAADVAHLGMQLGAALAYLHRCGWLHLDLKPGNIVAEGGRAKVIDLSIARRPGPARSRAGTHYYMAPEQARREVLSTATDVWGLGTVLYEAATGVPAFGGDLVEETTGSACATGEGATTGSSDYRDEPPPQVTVAPAAVRRHRRGLPRELADVIHACLHPDPACRPPLAYVLPTLEAVTGTPPAERVFAPVRPVWTVAVLEPVPG